MSLRSWTSKEDVVRVLLAIDGSAHSDAAVTEVAARSWPKGTSVRVLTVVHAAASFDSGSRIRDSCDSC